MNKKEAINMLIKTAEAEQGYLEKNSSGALYEKTANAGFGNYTKYWNDIMPSYQGQPWCAAFVSWCFQKCFGKEKSKLLLKHWPYVYCPRMASLFSLYSVPEAGDIVIFYRDGDFRHTGIVVNVREGLYETIEGNTSGVSGIVDNGGSVCRKRYSLQGTGATRFCRPDYAMLENEEEEPKLQVRGTLNKLPEAEGHVTARRLNVRQWAGTEYPNIISCPVLIQDERVEICDTLEAEDGSKWYYVRIAGKIYGFVSARYIAVS